MLQNLVIAVPIVSVLVSNQNVSKVSFIIMNFAHAHFSSLGGCNPFLSFKPTSCAPNPICISHPYTFDKPERLQPTSSYTGGTDVDFTYEGQPLFTGGNLIMSLAKGTQGTRVSTTRYLYYGRVLAKIKAARS